MLRVCETILNDVRGFISLIPRKTARKNGRSVTIPIFRSAGIETATTGQDGPRKRALVSFHSLWHTFVSMSANAGVPLAVVQSIVGHDNLRSSHNTRRYR